MSLVTNKEFLRHYRAFSALKSAEQAGPARDGYIFMIVRLNNDDALMHTFLAIGYQIPQKTGFGGSDGSTSINSMKAAKLASKGKAALAQNVHNANDMVAPAGQAFYDTGNRAGGHAEEMFIRKWPALVAELLNFSYPPVPTSVDVFVSKIPCGNMSQAFTLQIQGNTVFFPVGCGHKMRVLIDQYPTTAWTLTYDEVYTGAHQAASLAALAPLANRPNVSIGQSTPT